jgi:hypothetical protein
MSLTRVALPALATFSCLAAATPGRANALEPAAAVEVVLGAQDVPGASFIGAQPRLALRLDRDAPVALYGWIGFDLSLFSPQEGDFANGYGLDAAVGGDARTCTASHVCAGVRTTLGLQRLGYHHGDGDIGDPPETSSISGFVDLEPYVAIGRVTVALDARVHRLLDADAYEDDLVRYAGGISLGYSF